MLLNTHTQTLMLSSSILKKASIILFRQHEKLNKRSHERLTAVITQRNKSFQYS